MGGHFCLIKIHSLVLNLGSFMDSLLNMSPNLILKHNFP